VKISYDPEADVLAITLREVRPERGQQVTAGLVLMFDEDGEVVRMEILDASKHVDGQPLIVALELLAPEAALTGSR
jgi:uncharacterized protein YuzE